MGYDSVTNIRAVKVKRPEGEDCRGDDLYVLALEIADSNLTDEYGKMMRRWTVYLPATDWEVMKEVVKFASSCEGGGLRYKGRCDTKAETLIRACRKALESAEVVTDFTQAHNVTGLFFDSSLCFVVPRARLEQSEYYQESLSIAKLHGDVTVGEYDKYCKGYIIRVKIGVGDYEALSLVRDIASTFQAVINYESIQCA